MCPEVCCGYSKFRQVTVKIHHHTHSTLSSCWLLLGWWWLRFHFEEERSPSSSKGAQLGFSHYKIVFQLLEGSGARRTKENLRHWHDSQVAPGSLCSPNPLMKSSLSIILEEDPEITGKSLPNWNPSMSVACCHLQRSSVNEVCTPPQLCVVTKRGMREAWEKWSKERRPRNVSLPLDCPCCASHCKATLLTHGFSLTYLFSEKATSSHFSGIKWAASVERSYQVIF